VHIIDAGWWDTWQSRSTVSHLWDKAQRAYFGSMCVPKWSQNGMGTTTLPGPSPNYYFENLRKGLPAGCL